MADAEDIRAYACLPESPIQRAFPVETLEDEIYYLDIFFRTQSKGKSPTGYGIVEPIKSLALLTSTIAMRMMC